MVVENHDQWSNVDISLYIHHISPIAHCIATKVGPTKVGPTKVGPHPSRSDRVTDSERATNVLVMELLYSRTRHVVHCHKYGTMRFVVATHGI
jgi:hypothetical protein